MRANLMGEFFLMCLIAGIPWVFCCDLAPTGLIWGLETAKAWPLFVLGAIVVRHRYWKQALHKNDENEQ